MAGLQIVVPPTFTRWITGLAGAAPIVMAAAEQAWNTATEQFYGRTQEVAHILSGDMKASGRYQVRTEGTDVIGEVVYDSDHAIFEELRGGEHALLTRGFEQSSDGYQQAVGKAFGAIGGGT